ncbi:DUF6152 family protein [Microvirga terrestris]|uniref:DUF5666 domain-containing protein n=1 Tax=Microvirga terrestris TaxID=2791024 RepID=A0ABS0HRT3_9HYPH|nr:DUF6152 family protein [Microvirga terrestris]MBF9195932.1 hypothetical protein [Microvirga terrestris]
MKYPLFGLVFSGALLIGGIAVAHHGWGSYDAGRLISVTSNIQRANWENPHVTVGVTHENRNWDAVLAPPFRMSARGLNPDMLKPGTPVRLEGYPSTRTETELRAERIVVGGKTYELR